MHWEVFPRPTLPQITRMRLLGQRLNCLNSIVAKRRNTAATAMARSAGQGTFSGISGDRRGSTMGGPFDVVGRGDIDGIGTDPGYHHDLGPGGQFLLGGDRL